MLGPDGGGGDGDQEGLEGCFREKAARLEMSWIKMEEKVVEDASAFPACVKWLEDGFSH